MFEIGTIEFPLQICVSACSLPPFLSPPRTETAESSVDVFRHSIYVHSSCVHSMSYSQIICSSLRSIVYDLSSVYLVSRISRVSMLSIRLCVSIFKCLSSARFPCLSVHLWLCVICLPSYLKQLSKPTRERRGEEKRKEGKESGHSAVSGREERRMGNGPFLLIYAYKHTHAHAHIHVSH
jgi:hypothetical protein